MCFVRKGVFRNFTKFTGKKTCPRVFFNKVAGLRFKKRFWHRCFPVSFVKFLRTSFSQNTSWRLFFLCHLIPLVRFFQGLKCAYVVHILVFLDLIRFVCFYDLMNRGLFRTLSNIQVGAF